MIRALEHARVTLSMEVESSPTVLHIYTAPTGKSVLFGTIDGRIGILDIEKYLFENIITSNNKLTNFKFSIIQ